MVDLYSTTAIDISPAHVTDMGFARMLHEKASQARLEALQSDLAAKAKGSCRTCYGRGYVGMQGLTLVVCQCTTKTR